MPTLESRDTDGLGQSLRPERLTDLAVRGDMKELLKPESETHDNLLQYLLERLRASEREMSKFYARWSVLEKKVQAYIDLPDWEKILKETNDQGKPPRFVRVTLPVVYATVATITTFMLHTFLGRKPMFNIGSYKAETAGSAQNMEIVLQYQADHTRLPKYLYQFFSDMSIYGLAALRTRWLVEKGLRTVRQPILSMFNRDLGTRRVRREVTIYEGNEVISVDPFTFFPDPRVPMTEVNTRGEFVFCRSWEGRHLLENLEGEGQVFHTREVGNLIPNNDESGDSESSRSLLAGGSSHPGSQTPDQTRLRGFVQLDQGSVWIVPRNLGIGESEKPELWMFTIGNKKQIIQADRIDNDHGKHPICVAEPNATGYGFGNLSVADYVAPVQDSISWLMNSHITNVRKAINDVFVVNPGMIEMQDLKSPPEGRFIRLKDTAIGQDVRAAITQLQINDVTRGHIQDMELFFRIGQLISAVSENVFGIQDSGGRKTATEVRTAGEAAASRLSSTARIVSAQAITDLTEQMSLNTQQFLTESFFISVVGRDGIENPITVTPDQVVGDFYYPVHDGTLPIDKVALLDQWREILGLVLQDQELRTTYDVTKMMEHAAELGGVRNIEAMRRDQKQVEQIQAAANAIVSIGDEGGIDSQVQAGNLIPIDRSRVAEPTPL